MSKNRKKYRTISLRLDNYFDSPSYNFYILKISIFYKISMIPFDRAKFQLSESVLQITVR